MKNLPRNKTTKTRAYLSNSQHWATLLLLLSTGLLAGCADGDCMEQLTVDSHGKNHITVRWRHDCYTCDTWELCYKKEGVFNDWVCVPCATAGAVREGTCTVSGLESGATYLITLKNVMGEGCRLKTLGTVEQRTE